jgi:tetrapyrrole methylase family protein/MazG family protein
LIFFEGEQMPAGITIIGLGPGDPGLISHRAWMILENAGEVYLRTGQHPVTPHLPNTLKIHSFDDLYDELPDFESVYETIVERILELGVRPEGVIYAVPGDPMVGEFTVQQLLARSDDVRIVHGISFVEPCMALTGLDALDGLYVADALDLVTRHHPPFPPDTAALIGQLYSQLVAADVKLVLMNQYPAEHEVSVIHGAGTPEARVETIQLHELDRIKSIGSMTALLVPALTETSAFESFQETVAHLRAPDGCPWDREQTPQSLRMHLLEEAYETLQALDEEDRTALREELGDLLLQIVLQAQIATESGEFTMADVIAGVNRKIVHRHPHVFDGLEVDDVAHVLHNWESLKAEEREQEGEGEGTLDGVPKALPALAQALEIQSRVARVGFDWPDVEGVLAKVGEEMAELREADNAERRADEFGDLLFAVVNYARWLDVEPESALREANRRFERRFAKLEQAAKAAGQNLPDLSLEELDSLWEAAKKSD